MTRPSSRRLAPVCLTALAGFLVACGGDGEPDSPTGTAPEPQVAAVTVSPDSARLTEAGATRDFDATATDQDGEVVSGVSFTWSVSDTSVATVDSAGTVTAKAAGTTEVEAEADGVTGTSELRVTPSGDASLTCADLSLASASAVPLDTVRLSGIPDTMQAPLSALVAAGRDTGRVFVARTAGARGRMIVPTVPGGDPAGGRVSLQLTDGRVSCPAVDFTVEPLPEAPGTFRAVVDSLERIVELQGRALGVDTEALATASLDTLPKAAWPLALARNYIDGPDNPNSLQAIAQGSAPMLDGDTAAVDLASRLVAREQILGVLSAQLDSLRGRLDTASASSMVHPVTDPNLSARCTILGAMSEASTLDECMDAQHSSNFSLENNKVARSRLGKIVGTLGGLPVGKIPAAVVGAAFSVHAKLLEATAKLLPSDFVGGDVVLEETSYLEDQPGPDHWHDAWVRAASDGWTLDRMILEKIVSKLDLSGKFGTYVNNVLGGTQLTEDLITFLLSKLTSAAINQTEGSEVVRIPADTTPRIPIDDEQWSYQDVTSAGEAAVRFTGHRTYEPVRVGTSSIFVGTARDEFPGGNWTSEPREVEVRRMRVTVDPRVRSASPGQTRRFDVTVRNAYSYGDLVTKVSAGNVTRLSGGDGTVTVEVTTPGDETAFPVALVVSDTSSTGARANASRPRAGQGIVYKDGSLRIEPGGACLKHGQTRDFDAIVRGPSDPEVRWRATGGTIDGDGTLTAPGSDAKLAVKATNVSDTTLTDVAPVTVREECDTWWTVALGGSQLSGDTVEANPESGSGWLASLGQTLHELRTTGISAGEFAAFGYSGGRAAANGRPASGVRMLCAASEGGEPSPWPCWAQTLESSASRLTARVYGVACVHDLSAASAPCNRGVQPVTIWFSAPRIGPGSGSVDRSPLR